MPPTTRRSKGTPIHSILCSINVRHTGKYVMLSLKSWQSSVCVQTTGIGIWWTGWAGGKSSCWTTFSSTGLPWVENLIWLNPPWQTVINNALTMSKSTKVKTIVGDFPCPPGYSIYWRIGWSLQSACFVASHSIQLKSKLVRTSNVTEGWRCLSRPGILSLAYLFLKAGEVVLRNLPVGAGGRFM